MFGCQANGRFYGEETQAVTKIKISRLETVHENNLISRDVKPDNFLIGRKHWKNANTIHIVDFGMVKQYFNPRRKQHIPYRENRSLSGTARYMSINTHLQREQSRRDDLESLGYMLVYFMFGELPWQRIDASTYAKKYRLICEKKQTTSIAELCLGLPPEFQDYLNYVRHLHFTDKPDYDYLRSLFDMILKNAGEEDDGVYEWMYLKFDHIPYNDTRENGG